MVTIKDIAKQAGVSVSTVSNALNDSDKVIPETKAKVVQVALELGYVPNLNARRLKNRRTHNFGLFLPNFGGSYYVPLIQAMYEVCRESHHSLLIHVSDSISSRELSSVILSSNIDGAVILNEHLEEGDLPFLEDRAMPLVFLDKERVGPNISSVLLDNRQGIEAAVDYLWTTGHRSLVYVRGFPNYDDAARFAGFEASATKRGLEVRDPLWGWFSAETAYDEVVKKGFAAGRPDAFLCANDDMAKGCIRALNDLGWKVPQDISVVGFDDSDFASYSRPALTTVVNPVAEVGRSAIRELLRLEAGKGPGRLAWLETKLVVRDSVASRRASPQG